MAGVTDLAFRTICRELGAAYTITEMVSAKALCYQDKKTLPLMELGPEEHPGGVQIFGSDLACMEEGAAIIREVAHPDIIDINMGCPVPKVANNGDGSGLLRDLDKACRVAEAVIRGAQGTPVTVKMRLGWDKGNIVCLDLAKMLESVGVAAITLHGRTKVQMYSGTANWDYIREVKQALSIPVIANGDVFSGQDAARILRYTGADGVMIARGVFGNPWIFQQAQAALRGEPIPPLPPLGPAVRHRRAAVRAGRPEQGGEDRLPGGPQALRLVPQGGPLCRVLEERNLQNHHLGRRLPGHRRHQAGAAGWAQRWMTSGWWPWPRRATRMPSPCWSNATRPWSTTWPWAKPAARRTRRK